MKDDLGVHISARLWTFLNKARTEITRINKREQNDACTENKNVTLEPTKGV